MRLSLKIARNVWENFLYFKNDSKDWYYDILQYRTSLQNMIPSYATHTESFFTPQFLVNRPVYAITVIFIYLLSDKASNAELFQIFPCDFITPKLESSPIVT